MNVTCKKIAKKVLDVKLTVVKHPIDFLPKNYVNMPGVYPMLRSRTLYYFLIFVIVFTLLSIPFFTGMLHSLFTDRNAYALFYAFFELPITLIFSGVIRSLAEWLWDTPTVDQVDLAQFYFSLAFWSVLGAIIGWIRDIRGDQA